MVKGVAMNQRYFNGLKSIVSSGFMGLVSLVHAEVAYNEQIITSSGGVSVSMDGEWAAVGAYDVNNSSSCYVTIYKLDYTTMIWETYTTLGGNGNCNGNKGFGSALSLNNGEIVVGLSGYDKGSQKDIGAFSAYAYNSTSGLWELLIGPVIADDPQTNSGFGTAVNIQEGILLVGAPQHDGAAGADTGKVYLYERPPNFDNGLPETVTVEGIQSGSLFGSSVAGDYEDILIGASSYDQGGFTDNGAGFMYEYNASAPSLTQIGALYGSEDYEHLGLQLEHTDAVAVVAGTLNSYGYRFNGSDWQLDLTQEATLGGDVDIFNNVGAIATKGISVNLYPLLDSFVNSYFLDIVPSGTPAAEFAEDISLSQNYLLVSEADSNQARMYEMPCGYGGALVENEWAMVSIPCKISGQTVATIFGDDGLGIYDTNWIVYEQNSSNYSGKGIDAVKLDESSTIVQGKSYWIIADANVTWKVDSTASSTRTDLNTTMVPDPDVMAGTYAISLPIADQNVSGDIYAKVMVGNPFAHSFEWTNVQYYSVSDANISFPSLLSFNCPIIPAVLCWITVCVSGLIALTVVRAYHCANADSLLLLPLLLPHPIMIPISATVAPEKISFIFVFIMIFSSYFSNGISSLSPDCAFASILIQTPSFTEIVLLPTPGVTVTAVYGCPLTIELS